jgi:hypothetical protein
MRRCPPKNHCNHPLVATSFRRVRLVGTGADLQHSPFFSQLRLDKAILRESDSRTSVAEIDRKRRLQEDRDRSPRTIQLIVSQPCRPRKRYVRLQQPGLPLLTLRRPTRPSKYGVTESSSTCSPQVEVPVPRVSP